MQTMNIPFGFNTISLGNCLTVYTGKIRIKSDLAGQAIPSGISFSTGKNGCSILKWAVTDYTVHQSNILWVNQIMYNILVNRHYMKYIAVMPDSLPF